MTRIGFRASLTTLSVIAYLGLSASPVLASDEDGQLWTCVAATKRVSNDLDIAVDLNARYGDDASRLGQLLARVGLVRRITPEVALAGGYVYARASRAGDLTTHEHRAWQQVAWTIGAGGRGPTLTARTRAEQRFREGEGESAWRVRQQFRAQIPLGGGPVVAILAQETFLAANATRWSGRDGVEQLRAFIGVTRPLTNRLSVETGYLNQRLVRRGTDSVNHIALIALSARM